MSFILSKFLSEVTAVRLIVFEKQNGPISPIFKFAYLSLDDADVPKVIAMLPGWNWKLFVPICSIETLLM